MRTPARGHNCKHLQCFDLESFLFMNRDRSQWSCPICSLPIPFNMLELDKHQLNIIQAMCDVSNTDDILIDISGQWQAYYGPTPAPIGQPHQPVMQQQTQTQLAQSQTQTQISSFATAKSTGTYHPQPPMLAGNHQQGQQQQQQQPLRPMSANLGRPGQALVAQTSGSPAPWEAQQQHHVDQQLDQPLGPVRRPASAIGQPLGGGRRSTNGSPLAKKPYQGSQYSAAGQPAGAPSQFYPSAPEQQFGALVEPAGPTPTPADEDELSPLAAMERAIIQHEQQMGPPPFDPTSLTSSPARPSSMPVGQGPLTSSGAAAGPPAQAANGGTHHKLVAGAQSRSPVGDSRAGAVAAGAAFSPHNHPALSPAPGRVVSASPQHQLQRVGSAAPEALTPQSPMQPIAATTSISTPATPSMLVHGGPETPATPSNSGSSATAGGHLQQTASSASSSCSSASSATYSPHLQGAGGSAGGPQGSGQQQQQSGGGVDHQPLSNGSASAGSVTSSSTMTPSGQSLGSVGMGSDSRCGTAPLQTNPIGGLDELLHSAGSSFGNSSSLKSSSSSASLLHQPGGHLDHLEKNEILIGKLMDSRSDSLLRDHHHHHQHNYNQGAHNNNNHHHHHGAGELAIALEEAEWKQQLDRGKSEHLANFLNEPLMNKKALQQPQYHHKQAPTTTIAGSNGGEQQLLVAGNQTDTNDDPLELHGSSPACANLDQLTDFANYLDADAADDGAGLPPDDSILDLFER